MSDGILVIGGGYVVRVAKHSHIFLLKKYLGEQKSKLITLGTLLILGITLQLVAPQFLGRFIDAAKTGEELSILIRFGLYFIGVMLLSQAVTVIATYIGSLAGWIATNRLRSDLVEHSLSLSLDFHKNHSSGELVEKIDGDASVLTRFFASFAVELIGNSFLLIGILVILIVTNWQIGIWVTLFSGVAFAMLLKIRSIGAPFWKTFREARTKLLGFLTEALKANGDIRPLGAKPYIFYKINCLIKDLWVPSRNAQMAFAISWGSPILIFGFGDALAFLMIANQYQQGAISLGAGYTIFFYVALLARPLEQIRFQIQALQRADASIERINELLDTSKSSKALVTNQLPGEPFSVTFKDVKFNYPASDQIIINHLSFSLEKGKTLGLLGRTGSGKSTLSKLIFRFYQPASGVIALGDIPINTVSLKGLRSSIGLVTQEVQLMNTTIRNNASLFNPLISDSAILEALHILGLGEWLQQFPKGLDTIIDSSKLSAGEGQLLAITRVFLQKPKLLILDEASSRLDRATEVLLEHALDVLMRDLTTIVITHRLATIQRADQILIMEDGVAQEQGDRLTLLADKNSRFNHLLKTGLKDLQ